MVAFARIPSSLRVPFFYAEIDDTFAGRAARQQRTLLIGQMRSAGTATANAAVRVSSFAEASALFGVGSILAAMVQAYLLNDPVAELWALPVADDAGGTAATIVYTVTAGPTAAGVVPLYIAGQLVRVPVNAGDSTTVCATAVAAAINAAVNLPATAGASGAVVTITCRHKGTLGNDIDVRHALRGSIGGESLPTAYAATIAPNNNGATDPLLTTALAALGDEPFEAFVCPLTDATSLNALKSFMDEATGRWSWSKKKYGHVFAARRGTVGNLQSFGSGRNDNHASVLGFHGSPTPAWVWAAAFGGTCARSLRNDPGRPLHSLEVKGVEPPAPGTSRFTLAEQNALLFDGVSTYEIDRASAVRLGRVITLWQVNQFGQDDDAWLDVTTPHTLAEVLRRLEFAVNAKFGRHKLANDGTRFGPGAPIVTPRLVRAHLVDEYRQMERDGLVENADLFEEHLVVERNGGDPTRIDVVFPPDLVNPLNILAVLAQFRLQYEQPLN